MNSKADHLAIKEADQTSLEVTARTAEKRCAATAWPAPLLNEFEVIDLCTITMHQGTLERRTNPVSMSLLLELRDWIDLSSRELESPTSVVMSLVSEFGELAPLKAAAIAAEFWALQDLTMFNLWKKIAEVALSENATRNPVLN